MRGTYRTRRRIYPRSKTKHLRHALDEEADMLEDTGITPRDHEALRGFVHRLVAHPVGAKMHRHEGL